MSPKTQDNGFKRPSNEEAILPGLDKERREAYMEWRQAAAKAVQKRPELKTEALTGFLHDYLDMLKKHQKKEDDAIAKAKKDPHLGVNVRNLRAENAAEYKEFMREFQFEKLESKYGGDGKEIFNETLKEMRGPGIFDAAFSQVYNREKGGLQWGGILGLLAGGIIANQMIPGGVMGGGLFGILGALGLGFMGAWLGNKGGDLIGGMFKKDPVPGASPAPAQGQAPAPERDSPAAAAARDPAEPELSPEERARRQAGPPAEQPFESKPVDPTNPLAPAALAAQPRQPEPPKSPEQKPAPDEVLRLAPGEEDPSTIGKPGGLPYDTFCHSTDKKSR